MIPVVIAMILKKIIRVNNLNKIIISKLKMFIQVTVVIIVKEKFQIQ